MASEEDIEALLGEFFDGYPVDRILELLESDDEGVSATGAWIASELGEQVCSVFGSLRCFVRHPATEVRFYMAEVLLTCASDKDGSVVAETLSLLEDAEAAVRWKVLTLARNLCASKLRSATPHLPDEWELVLCQDPAHLRGAVRAKSGVVRRLAVLAAARLGEQGLDALKQAVTQVTYPDEQDIADFVTYTLEDSGGPLHS